MQNLFGREEGTNSFLPELLNSICTLENFCCRIVIVMESQISRRHFSQLACLLFLTLAVVVLVSCIRDKSHSTTIPSEIPVPHTTTSTPVPAPPIDSTRLYPTTTLPLSYKLASQSGVQDETIGAYIIRVTYLSDAVDLPVYATIMRFSSNESAQAKEASALKSYLDGLTQSAAAAVPGQVSQLVVQGRTTRRQDINVSETILKLYEWRDQQYLFFVLGPTAVNQDIALVFTELFKY